MGIVEDVGEDVRRVQPGDRVFAPFLVSCGECEFCRRGLHTSCVNGDSWSGENGGAQGEYVRVPHADGTLVRVPDRYADDEDALEALLPLTDVMGTGHHADRLAIADEFGATDTVLADDDTDALERVRDLTNGGVDHVMECVGAASSMTTAVDICRPGGTVGYVGVPHGIDAEGLELYDFFSDNITLRGGVAPVRAYAEDLMADVLGGTLDPSPVFDMTVDLDGVPEGYQAMADREALKVLVKP